MIWLSDKKIAVALLPKVASSSIRDAVKLDYAPIDTDEVVSVPRRIAWIRNPMDRLISAFSFYHYSVAGLPGSITGCWSDFVDYTLRVDDEHWAPQVDLLTHKGVFLPNELYRFEDLQKTWPYKGLLPWLRGTRHIDVDESYRRAELDERYEGDYELCRSVAI